ncbi:Aste57867_22349 [Aphanomyces stellatus]|uniref:Aste57867_22349 protein n=1 Tax=Aphanomyces stellatus TaxID=120398 RepID=A0A485LLC3_9STRA|nr:hypothetical protein As57867_022279 [Aphanomyces stellatus]VFT99012.1 Aste57867_22349 [Aphanomyces stellatus]
MSAVKESKTMDQLLVEGSWNIYYVSGLYQFKHDRDTLATDATDLVTFLRAADDDRDLKRHQEVTVNVRAKNDLAMFVIHEQVADGTRPPTRVGAFVYYTPHQRGAPPPANTNGTHLLLLQGNEHLVVRMCAWVQHRFQCVIALNALRIQSVCMEQFAQSLFHAIAQHGDDDDGQVHAPLKLTLRSESDDKIVRSVAISIPRRDIQAKHELQRERRNTMVDQGHRMIRSLMLPYCAQLGVDMPTFRLASISSYDCSLDNTGILSLRRADRAIDILDDLLDIFVVQNVTVPDTAETSF